MRPDLDDYDELNIGDSSARARAMSWLVLLVAIGGFTSLAYYAYKSGSQAMRDSTVTVVNADEAPIKAAPADPQGEQFPNKDKTIYDAIAAQDGKGQHVEKLMPGPERPVIPESEDNDLAADAPADKPRTTTYVNDAAKGDVIDPVDAQSPKKTAPVAAAPAQPAPSKPATVAAAPEKPAVTAKAETVAPETDTEEAQAAAPEKSAAAPEMVNVKPVTSASQSTSEVKDAQAKATKTTKPVKAVAAAPTGGSYKIQLGAFKSEEEAQAQWYKISAKNSDIVGGSPIIEKTENPKGTFYRLRASGFASAAAAKIACSTLSARHQACFPAGK